MEGLFQKLQAALTAGKDCMLAALVESTGSAPRSAGAFMLVGDSGRIYGTIGGGNLEYRATIRAGELLKMRENCLADYDLAVGSEKGLGMISGGGAKVLYRCFCHDCGEDLAFAEQALKLARAHETYHLLLPLSGGRPQLREEFDGPRRHYGYEEAGETYYLEQFNFDGKVYVFGAGHLSQELVPVLSHVGFHCIVADDRPEFARAELFPRAESVKLVDFAAPQLPIRARDYVVVASRSHLTDADCIRFVLKTEAKFVGMVGSRKKVKFIRETMAQEGFSKECIDRIISPIGLDIGGETPAEIAISIAAQMIRFRSDHNG